MLWTVVQWPEMAQQAVIELLLKTQIKKEGFGCQGRKRNSATRELENLYIQVTSFLISQPNPMM